MAPKETEKPLLTSRFEEALVYAARLHANQVRKGSDVPYISHLLGVTALVIEDGGDEDQAIAALLHDAVEDQGGYKTLAEIRRLYWDRVAEIVEALTDAFTTPKPPWRERKERYLEHLRHATPEVRRVSLADKLHNARSILNDLRSDGEGIWDRFNGGKEGTLWYYRSLLGVFETGGLKGMVVDFAYTLEEIELLAGELD